MAWNGGPLPKPILIVEDESQVRALLELVLSNEGFDVIEAEDGTRALTILRRRRRAN